MKKIAIILTAALTGIAAILILNTTKVSEIGLGIELPIGWEMQPHTTAEICASEMRYPKGLPFVTSRSQEECDYGVNSLARDLNLLIGAGLGALAGLLITKIFIGQSRKPPVSK